MRTDPKADKHEGIGFLLIDMKTPGIEVAPLVQMTGSRGFSQCFFKDVEVPAANLIGAPTQGWQIANTVLGYERGASTLSRYAGYRREFEQLVEDARRVRKSRDGVYRQRIAQAAIELEVLRLNSLRSLTALAQGTKPGSESSLQKLYYSEMGAAARAARHRPRGRVRTARAQDAPRARGRTLGAAAPAEPRPDDLRGHERDPAQHHLRARARTAAALVSGASSALARSSSCRRNAIQRGCPRQSSPVRPGAVFRSAAARPSHTRPLQRASTTTESSGAAGARSENSRP